MEDVDRAGVVSVAWHNSAPREGRWIDLAALVLLVGGIYFARLAVSPVCGEESRWASAAREMIATGDWIVPRQQGTVFPERPPLGSWAMAAVGIVRGEVDLVAIRLPSALATLTLVILIYCYARTWTSRLASLAAATIYATGGQVMQLGRSGESEAVFTLFTGGALLVWHGLYLSGRSRALAWCAGYTMAALGALVKGPQAPVYFATACGAYLVLRRDWRWLFSWGHLAGLVSFAALVSAWAVPFAVTNWNTFDDIWSGLARDRFTLEGLPKHLVSYPLETFGCLLPWSPLLLPLLNPTVRKSLFGTHPQVKFLLVALAVTYPSVWLAAGARGRYYMPLYPCLAVLMGLVIDHCTAGFARRAERMFWRHFQRVTAIAVGVGGAVILLASLLPIASLDGVSQPVAFVCLWTPAVIACAALLVWCSQAEKLPRPQIAVLALGALLGLANTGVLLNARLRAANDLQPIVATLQRQLPPGNLVSLGRIDHRFAYSYDTPIPQISWPMTSSDLPPDVEYFCFDRRPGDTAEVRSTSDGRSSTTTPGTLPFEWEEVAAIPCDPVHRDVPSRTVIIGRVRRPQLLASPSTRTLR